MAILATRPRRNRFLFQEKGASPIVVPITAGPYGTGVLDNFETTANQNLTGRTGWGGTFVNGDSSMRTDSIPHNAVATPLQSNFWGAFNGPDYVRSSEGWGQVAAFDQTLDQIMLGTRITGTGATFTFYSVILDTVNQWKPTKWVSAANTQLGSTLTQRVVEGDGIAVAVRDKTVETWYRPNGGAWTLMSTIQDSGINNNGGPLAIICRPGSGRSQSFSVVGGGDLSAYRHVTGTRAVYAGRN